MEGRNVQLEAPAARSGSEAHPQRILGWRLKTSRTQPNSSLTSHTHTPLLLPSFLPFTPSPSLPPHISLAALQTKEEATERKKPRNLPPCACGGEVQGRGSCLRRRRGKGGRREAAPAPAPGARASCAAPRPGCTAAPTRPRSAGAATRRCTAPTSWWRATRARSCAGAARAPRRGAPRARASAPPPPSATAASAAALALWAWAAATRRWAARATAAATKKRTTTTTAATMTTRWSLRTTRMRRRRRRKGRGRTRSCRGRRRPRRRRRPSPVPRPAAAGRPPPTARAPQIAQRKTCRAPPRSRACATTCRQRTTAAAATRPPPPGTVAGSSPPPATGRDHPQISSALGRRNPGAALRRGIAPTRALAEMTLPEAGNM